jgi:hypothetical protein
LSRNDFAPHRETTTQTERMGSARRFVLLKKYLFLLTVLVDAQGIEPWTSPV